MTDTATRAEEPEKSPKPAGRKRSWRRRIIRAGKWLTYRLASYQAQQSLVPEAPFVANELFPFLKELEDRWEEIAAEAREVVKLREHIPNIQDISPDQANIATASNWKSFFLYGFGIPLERNCVQAPATTEILGRVPGIQTAFFSILAPGYHIPAHTGITKAVLRVHLGLIIPKEREKCRIRVGDQIKAWQAGKAFVLDDTYEHEVWNDTDEERVILLFDFDRPMRFGGRMVSRLFLQLMKLTAFYQEPKKNLLDSETRFAAATQRANENLEKLADL
jgi:aspartyl/asparaginyl beta-hydroxylase (cupin superfamily)